VNGRKSATAVIFHGLVHRSLDFTIHSIQKNLLKPLSELGSVDIFFHTWGITSLSNPRAGELDLTIDPDCINKHLRGAKGIVEDQTAFDNSIDWPAFLAEHRMYECIRNESAFLTTQKNYWRSLESQERAWRYFEATKNTRYDRVVATRSDLLFSNSFKIRDSKQALLPECNVIHVPQFHSFKGINDRFAFGSENAIKVWSNKREFATKYTRETPGLATSEKILLEWLDERGIDVRKECIQFARIRGNGKVVGRDRRFL
jgi:hypothetical protein